MPNHNNKLDLTWIGKKNRPKLEPSGLAHGKGQPQRRDACNDRRYDLFNFQRIISRRNEELTGKAVRRLKDMDMPEMVSVGRWRLK